MSTSYVGRWLDLVRGGRDDDAASRLARLLDDRSVAAAILVDVDSGMPLASYEGRGGTLDLELLGATHADLVRGAVETLATMHPAGPPTELVLSHDDEFHHLLRTVPDPYGGLLVLSVLVAGPARNVARLRQRMRGIEARALVPRPVSARPAHSVPPQDPHAAAPVHAPAPTAPVVPGAAPALPPAADAPSFRHLIADPGLRTLAASAAPTPDRPPIAPAPAPRTPEPAQAMGGRNGSGTNGGIGSNGSNGSNGTEERHRDPAPWSTVAADGRPPAAEPGTERALLPWAAVPAPRDADAQAPTLRDLVAPGPAFRTLPLQAVRPVVLGAAPSAPSAPSALPSPPASPSASFSASAPSSASAPAGSTWFTPGTAPEDVAAPLPRPPSWLSPAGGPLPGGPTQRPAPDPRPGSGP